MGMAFDPRTRDWTLAGGAGQYGMTLDDWGVKFASSNSTPVWQVMYDSRYLARNPVAVGCQRRPGNLEDRSDLDLAPH